MDQSLIYAHLKSSSPKQRYQAIKAVAKARDQSMLSVLADMARTDPDEQVRNVASKAEQYLKTDVSQSSATEVEDSSAVKPEVREKASAFVNEALGYQMRGEVNRALKSLSKAVELYPGIIKDHFFVSVLDATTGKHGAESLAMLQKTEIKKARVSEQQLEREKRAKSHQNNVTKVTWGAAVVDLLIYTCILLGGTILVVLLVGQMADGVITGYNAAVDSYWAAVNAGDKSAKMPDPVDPALWMQAEHLRTIGFTTAAIAGGLVGVSSLLSMLVQLGITHAVARLLFRGQGTLPYLIYKIVSIYNSNMPVILGILILGIILTFSTGSGIILIIAGGLIGLLSLKLSFQTLKKVAEAYNFSFMQGCLSVIVGSIILSIISFAVQLALMNSVTQLILESVGGG